MYETFLPVTAAVLFIVLAIIVIARKRNTANVSLGLTLTLLALTEIADWLPFTQWYTPETLSRVLLIPVSLLPGMLLFYSLTYARNIHEKSISVFWKVLLAVSAIFPMSVVLFPVIAFFYAPDLQTEKMLFLGTVGFWFYMGILMYCVLSLMNLEVTFSATTGSNRYGIKFEVIGFATILAVLIFYFSQGLLYRTINMNLAPVRSGVFILAAFLLGYSKFFRGNNVAITVSRYVFYRSLTLFVVGLYLLILGFIGEGIRYLGDSFSRNLAIFIAFATGVALFLVLFSEKLRRRAKVFVNKHFYPHKHDYREAWLGFTGRLASCRSFDEVMAAVLTTYREAFGLKGCALYLLDGAGRMFVRTAYQGVPDAYAELPATTPLITYFLEKDRVFNSSHKEYMPAPHETDFVSTTEARLLVPLVDNKEAVRGIVVLSEQLAFEEYIYEDYDLMKTFAQQALLSLDNFRLVEELADTREVAAVAKVSSFVVHDLKNLASSLSMLLENARDYIHEPEFQADMLDTIRNSLDKMNKLTQQLKMTQDSVMLETGSVDIRNLAEEAIREIKKTCGQALIECEGTSAFSVVNPEQIRNVIHNLLLNALEASGEHVSIQVNIGVEGSRAYARVQDAGCG
ncbi:MAG TPA: PEP-CTERM system histidine kinase PrsK, partial [Geobacteraceae bacterium]|nr:PEP-CTERM system histidine kinase PrsK [Geobacteraceae bacterium]